MSWGVFWCKHCRQRWGPSHWTTEGLCRRCMHVREGWAWCAAIIGMAEAIREREANVHRVWCMMCADPIEDSVALSSGGYYFCSRTCASRWQGFRT